MMNQVYLGTLAGGAALAILVGLAKMTRHLRRWREDSQKFKPPWDRV